MKLIIIRHGETLENKTCIVQGQSAGTLTSEGIEQAKRVAYQLKNETIECIYSSDLTRAVSTADILAKELNGIPLYYDGRLREQNFGKYEQGSHSSMLRQMRRAKQDFCSFNPSGGEPAVDFRRRIKSFIDELVAEHKDKSIALVTHYGVIHAITRLFHAGDAKERIGNCSVTILELEYTELDLVPSS